MNILEYGDDKDKDYWIPQVIRNTQFTKDWTYRSSDMTIEKLGI